MHVGLVTSLLMHVALLAWALFTIQSTPELRIPEETPIEVALIDASEFTRLKKGALDVTELEAKAKDAPKPEQSVKEAPKPKPVEAETPPAPPPEAAKPEPPKPDPIAEKLAATPPPEPAPGPSPDEQQKLAELAAKADQERKAEEKRKADEAKKKVEEKKKADERKKRIEQQRKEREAKKKKSDADRLAALLDKDPTPRGAPNSATDPTKPTDYTGRTAGANQGDDTVLSAREADLLASQLRAQLRECWSLPGGGGGAELPVVVLSWRLRPDGSLDGEPRVISPGSDAAFQVAMEAAVRAVKKCSPFDLPPDKYHAWGLIEEWSFNPREML